MQLLYSGYEYLVVINDVTHTLRCYEAALILSSAPNVPSFEVPKLSGSAKADPLVVCRTGIWYQALPQHTDYMRKNWCVIRATAVDTLSEISIPIRYM